MGMQNQNGATERKTVIYLTTNEMVDLLIEWAETSKLPEWLDKMMEDIQAKSFSDHPATEEEKISFIAAFVYYLPHDSPLREVAIRFLRSYDSDWVICEGNP
jgi:hypothetical protein